MHLSKGESYMASEKPLELERLTNPPLKRIIVATEGMNTEPSYFSHLNKLFAPRRIIAIPRNSHSSPPQVLKELIEYLKGDMLENDEYWLVLDVDDWTAVQKQKIEDWCSEAPARNNLAVSNPCFELWLILHFEEPPKFKRSRACKRYYNENYGNVDTNEDYEYIQSIDVENAINRAESRDNTGDSGWPETSGITTVYKLVKKYFEE